MEHTSDGLTLWYGDDRTPIPSASVAANEPICVTVGVRPGGVGNHVDVEYRIDGGPIRLLPSTLVKSGGLQGPQFFKAVFPYLSPGSTVEYTPILRSLGRRVGPPLGRGTPESFSVLPSGGAARGERPAPSHADPLRTPHAPRQELRPPFAHSLDRLAQVRASLAPPQVIGATPDGLRVHFQITGGRILGDRFKARVEGGGGDSLRIRQDGTGIVAVRTMLRTDDGAVVYTEYSGVLDLGPDGFHAALRGDYPSHPQVYLAPRFVCASPDYAWLNRLQCLGIGYVTMAQREVNYDLYVMRLSGEAP